LLRRASKLFCLRAGFEEISQIFWERSKLKFDSLYRSHIERSFLFRGF
jgi:hypothetical protein